jgi:hypothetical protein
MRWVTWRAISARLSYKQRAEQLTRGVVVVVLLLLLLVLAGGSLRTRPRTEIKAMPYCE